ncbi:MAG: hypothetical protein O3A63_08070 [Proteobacteria bacterium]|nr:hypothetical protein [Pseudomonadota bacterium]
MTLLLELNDCDLKLHDGSRVVYSEPAIAIVDKTEVTFGRAAQRSMRLKPQQTNQQYLSRLNADPLPVSGAGAKNHADLVYLHLKAIADLITADVVVAVPGTLTNDQLGVFLGIAQESGISISGFVDAAVLWSNSLDLPQASCHLDLHQTGACLTSLATGTETQRSRAETVSGCGLMSIVDGWVNLVADRFVQETRFDPLHSAATEQQVYDQVDRWARTPGSNDLSVQIDHQGQTRVVEVSSNALLAKLAQRLNHLVDLIPSGSTVVLTPRGGTLPGLARHLELAGANVQILTDEALTVAFNSHRNLLVDASNLRVIKALPHTGSIRPAAAAVVPATHVLHNSRAYPLATNPFGLPTEGAAGEVITHGGSTYQLIVVET